MSFQRTFRSLTRISRRNRKQVWRPVSNAEALEARHLLAGNVLVELNANGLVISGDSSDNDILIQAVNGNLVASGLNGTTINGAAGDSVLATGSTTITGRIAADLSTGNNLLTFTGITVTSDASVAGGNGNDQLGMNNVTIGGSLQFMGYKGDDSVWLNNVTVSNSVYLELGDGNNSTFIDGSTIGNDLHIKGRRGDQDIRIEDTTIGDDLHIRTHRGNDDIALTNVTITDDLHVRTHRGSDLVRLNPVQVGDNTNIRLGKDNDQLQILGTSSFGDDLKVQGNQGSDSTEIATTVTVGDRSRIRSVESSTMDATQFTTRFDDATTGLFAVTDALATQFSTRIEPADLTLTLDTSANQSIASNNTIIVNNASFQISGTTSAGATVSVDVDGDGNFNEGTATAGADGTFTVTTTLINDRTNRGENQVVVRSEDALSRSVEESVNVHFAVGTVSRFTTSQGTFDVELFDTDAPITVANFLNYDARYTNSIIHRSAKTQAGGDFVIQGGGFRLNPDLERIPTDAAIQNEFNALNSNVRGTLSMALGASPQSGTSQWFFNTVDNSFLDANQHAVFGFVIGSGMSVVDAIHDLAIFDLRDVLADVALGQLPLDGYQELTQTITGTVSTTSGSAILTGTGTSFTTELNAGQRLQIGDEIFNILQIVSDTEITLNVNAVETVTDSTAIESADPTTEQYVTISDIETLLFT